MSEIILAIETSTDEGSIALQIKSEIHALALDKTKPASATLLPNILKLVSSQGISLADIDLFVYGDGPGAFTGLRTACATAQALALPGQKALVGVCTLRAVAMHGGHEKTWVQLDARMGEWYAAAYQGAEEIVSPEVAKNEYLTAVDADFVVLHDKPTATGLLLAHTFYPRVSAKEATLRYVRNKVAQTEKEREKERGVA